MHRLLVRRAQRLFWIVGCWLILAGGAHAALTLPENPDVRVIVDISGSMKKNDPENLRRPAVRLISSLLPEGSTAGVWTFGQYVNMLVKHRPVDEAWKQEVLKASEKINSVALFTNIGGALEKATDDFSPGKTFPNTHIILLSDGMVDISKKPDENVAERRRILSEVLPRIKEAGATVHTIALSDNADKNLLETLALETGGMAVVAKTAQELSQVFVQTLEQAVPAEEVPLKGNTFEIDSTVEEFTALLFKAPGAPATELVDPSGKSLTATEHGDDVNWLSEPGFDLITVKQPFEGNWTLNATPAPGSRVTVVSNLRMVMAKLPANFYAGDRLDIEVGFYEDGQPVTDPAFLKLIDVDITVEFEDGKSGTKRISDPNNVPPDGVFRDAITKLKTVGRYKVIATADGKTFRRQARQLITLQPPFAVELEATGSGETTRYLLTATPRNPNIDVSGSSIVVKIKAPDGSTLIKTMPFVNETRRWELPIESTKGEGEYTLEMTVKAALTNGASFQFNPKAVIAEFPRQEASPNNFQSLVEPDQFNAINEKLTEEPVIQKSPEPEQAEPVIEPPISPEAIAQAEAEQQAAEADSSGEEPPPAEEGGSTWLIVALAGGGTLLILLGGLGFWMWRKKKIEQEVMQARARRKEGGGGRPSLREESEAEASTETPADEPVGEPDLEDEIEQLEQPEPLDVDVAEFDEPEEVATPEVTDLEDSIVAEDVTDVPEVPPAEESAADELEFDIGAVDEIEAAFDEAGSEPESEPELPPDPEPETPGPDAEAPEAAEDVDAEALADQILQENEEARKRIEDDEFNLEDFDIADVDDLEDEPKKPDA